MTDSCHAVFSQVRDGWLIFLWFISVQRPFDISLIISTLIVMKIIFQGSFAIKKYIFPYFSLPMEHNLSRSPPHAYTSAPRTVLSPLAFNLFIVCQCQEVQIKLVKDLLHSYSLMIIYLAVLCNPVIDKHSINLLRDKSTLVIFLPAIRFRSSGLQQNGLPVNYKLWVLFTYIN